MENYVIIDANGNHRDYIFAENERIALCKYLMMHEELTDMMLWKSTSSDMWKLAEYDSEEKYLTARRMTQKELTAFVMKNLNKLASTDLMQIHKIAKEIVDKRMEKCELDEESSDAKFKAMFGI